MNRTDDHTDDHMDDYTDDYRIALELAACSRYNEARVKLERILSRRPADVACLVLLGKVQYYLRRFRSSRSCFETALTYDPGNMAAFFGLQYYKERALRNGFVLSLVASLLLVLVAVGSFAFRVDSSLEELRSSVGGIEETFRRDSASLEASHELVLQRLGALSRRLESYERSLDALREETEPRRRRLTLLQESVSKLAAVQNTILDRLETLARTLDRELDDPDR